MKVGAVQERPPSLNRSQSVGRSHGPIYEWIEMVTPTPVKSVAKRVYLFVRRRINRWRHLETGRLVELRSRFRYDRAAPYRTRVGARTIVEDFNVWNACLGDIEVGERCWFGLNNVVMGPVVIGDNFSAGQFVSILGPRRPSSNERVESERTTIGRNVWISTGAIVLFGVSVGDNAVISAGAVVSEDVPANTMYVQRARDLYLPLEKTQIRDPTV